MHSLNISANDWQVANAYFAQYPFAVKMPKKLSGRAYSFVKVNNRIVGVGYKLGAGTFGVVKMAEDEMGQNYAIKVEGGALNLNDVEEEHILNQMGYSFGMVNRTLDSTKTFLQHIPSLTFMSNIKKYKLLELLEGNDLIFELYDKKSYEQKKYSPINKLNSTQKLQIAILCCQQLMQLHSKRILHADIKPENIKVKIENDNITVRFMDFGFSKILPYSSLSIVDPTVCNLPPYMAPEIFSQKAFSFESDIYSLGVMFRDHLKLDPAIYEGMLKNAPWERDKLETTINKLLSQLPSKNHRDVKSSSEEMLVEEQIVPNEINLHNNFNNVALTFGDFSYAIEGFNYFLKAQTASSLFDTSHYELPAKLNHKIINFTNLARAQGFFPPSQYEIENSFLEMMHSLLEIVKSPSGGPFAAKHLLGFMMFHNFTLQRQNGISHIADIIGEDMFSSENKEWLQAQGYPQRSELEHLIRVNQAPTISMHQPTSFTPCYIQFQQPTEVPLLYRQPVLRA